MICIVNPVDGPYMALHDEPGDRALERKRRDWAKQEKLELDAAVESLLAHPHGRRYLFWLLTIGQAIGENAFTGNALSTSFNCGQQNVGQQIMAHILEVSSEGFLTMLKEMEDERRQRASVAVDGYSAEES